MQTLLICARLILVNGEACGLRAGWPVSRDVGRSPCRSGAHWRVAFHDRLGAPRLVSDETAGAVETHRPVPIVQTFDANLAIARGGMDESALADVDRHV